MGKGVLNAETAGVVGRDKDSHWEQPLPMVGRECLSRASREDLQQ